MASTGIFLLFEVFIPLQTQMGGELQLPPENSPNLQAQDLRRQKCLFGRARVQVGEGVTLPEVTGEGPASALGPAQ